MMTDLMRTLYDYIHERQVEKYFVDGEYYRVQQVIRLREEELLREHPELREDLDGLFSEMNLRHALEQEASFQAGFLLRGELIRLQRNYEGLFE